MLDLDPAADLPQLHLSQTARTPADVTAAKVSSEQLEFHCYLPYSLAMNVLRAQRLVICGAIL